MILLRTLLKFSDFTIREEIESVTEYLQEVDELAFSQKEKLKKQVEKLVNKNPEDELEIYDSFSDQYSMYGTKYIQLTNNSSLVNSYSFFEHQLKHLLDILERCLLVKKPLQKRTGSLPEVLKLRNRIVDITGLDFSSLDATWSILDTYRKIRNLIVHDGASLPKNKNLKLEDQAEYKLINSISEIKLEKNGSFYIADKEFVIKYLNLIGQYLRDMIKILETLDKKIIK